MHTDRFGAGHTCCQEITMKIPHFYGGASPHDTRGFALSNRPDPFYDWLRSVEEQLGRTVPSAEAARMFNAGVAVMDAVVRLAAA